MPIETFGQTKIIFGNGDIRVSRGYVKENNSIGVIGFSNGEPVEIGTEKQELIYPGDCPIIFEFHKTESIDAVIKQLESVKNYMIENMDTKPVNN